MMTNEKELFSAGTPKSSKVNNPITLYHVIRHKKGNPTMIEIKIIGESAAEVTNEVLALAARVAGPDVEVKAEPVKTEEPATVEEPKAAEPVKAEPVKTEEPAPVEQPKEEPVIVPEAKAEAPQTIGAEVVEKVKAALKHADKKAAFKAWLDANGYERLTVVPPERGAEVLAALGIE